MPLSPKLVESREKSFAVVLIKLTSWQHLRYTATFVYKLIAVAVAAAALLPLQW